MSQNTGMIGHTFHRCPQSPNCVSTMASIKDETHYVAPLSYTGTLEQAQERLAQIIQAMPRQHLIKKESRYWHYTFHSRVFRFVDNVEFYFPPRQKIIHMRSAAEMGYSDMGVNRARLEAIRQAFMQHATETLAPSGL